MVRSGFTSLKVGVRNWVPALLDPIGPYDNMKMSYKSNLPGRKLIRLKVCSHKAIVIATIFHETS